jgi:ATP-dependent RNA helicase RhlE
LAPTRELAIQISESCATYGKGVPFRQALVYGGVSQVNQVRMLNRGAHILVATPGRLLDLMNQGHVRLDQLEVFVLDEADRMLDMGFLPDLKRIISKLPNQRQSLFFSATLPPKIIELSKTLLKNPVSVNVTPPSPSVEKIAQQVLFVERGGKQALLRGILMAAEVDRALVFTRTKRGANVLAQKLARNGIQATAIHGNKSQSARLRALAAFRGNQVRVLVATDVAARGIDIDGITHVVNFDLPDEPESYLHRIGRTGRAGAGGIAISFCTAGERSQWTAIEKLIGIKVRRATGSEHPPVDFEEPSRSDSSGSRQPTSEPPAAPKRKGSSSYRSARYAAEAAQQDNQPKQRRPRRSRGAWQRAGQAIERAVGA